MRKSAVTIIIILVAGIAAFLVYVFRPVLGDKPRVASKLEVADYETVVSGISNSINELSPTPAVGGEWMVSDIEAAAGTNLVYATYTDTHNVFRILVSAAKPERDFVYKVEATFEPVSQGGAVTWKLTHGEDLAVGKQLIKISK
ncbi:hypothetical protein D4R52_01330 [bacterium]|nr:MAG: hypothetical protein D4R52_01330 [bacterium]